jgi:heme/copper-type cytochrome/quinol oxidase subunit 2
MKIHSIFTLVPLLALGIAACSDDHPAPQSKQRESAEVNRLNRELEKAETNVSKQESAKAWWQSIATFLAIAAISLLVIGTIIGSSARHESER